MATLIFSALGTALGGPFGGAIGALVGRQIDGAIIGGSSREGPRLKELSVTTSTYGSAIGRHYGRMRVAGSIIWATDLVEHSDTQGGKGSPSVTTYTYSASFAVALASKPLARLGRIWADGNLLRGAGGDLKAGGTLRFYQGYADQDRDPLLAAAEGSERCPAYRGISYVVFENLQLADFGNRIPALTFEVFADEARVTLADLVGEVIDNVDAAVSLVGIEGLSCEGAVADILEQLSPVFPLDCDVSGTALSLRAPSASTQITLADKVVSHADDGTGAKSGSARRRLAEPATPPAILRYYDVDRDYQPGLQRAAGSHGSAQPGGIELPVAMAATTARGMIEQVSHREGWGRQALTWRLAQIDPAVRPGAVVRVPDHAGLWRVEDWEWREAGIELGLRRVPGDITGSPTADAGRLIAPVDTAIGTTTLCAFELPWDGTGLGDAPQIYAAVSSPTRTWAGAALYLDDGDGQLQSLGPAGRARSVIGRSTGLLPKGSPLLFDRTSELVVELIGDDMALSNATARQLAGGANRALLGSELIQFIEATPLGARRWRLRGLLRGRGGTELACSGHVAGESFVLLDSTPRALDDTVVGSNPLASIAAIGTADTASATSAIHCRGLTQRPLFPVHARMAATSDGGLELGWTRRARAAWTWLDGVETPLHEEGEAYDVLFGPREAPLSMWSTSVPALTLPSSVVEELRTLAPSGPFWVRQRGSYAGSDSAFIANLT